MGRTLVFTSFKLARNFLIQIFPGSRYGSCPGTTARKSPAAAKVGGDGRPGGARADASSGVSGGHRRWPNASETGVKTGGRRRRAVAQLEGVVWAYLTLGSWERTRVNVSALDSVQILNHKEYFSGEARHHTLSMLTTRDWPCRTPQRNASQLACPLPIHVRLRDDYSNLRLHRYSLLRGRRATRSCCCAAPSATISRRSRA